MIMDFLREEFESWRRTLPESAVPELDVFPLPEGADKRSARVRVETPARIADLLVWDSGEADLMAASLVTGHIEVMDTRSVWQGPAGSRQCRSELYVCLARTDMVRR